MTKKAKFALLLIIILAFLLRFYKVTQIPPSLNWDEVAIGYNAYSILKTGKDEWNKPFPIHFKSYGEYKLPTQIYASIPGIYFFGLNTLGVRITPVIYGVLTVLVVFFLGRALFASQLSGLIASFLLAISPWHIHLTRASFESSFATFWVALGIWLLVKGFKDYKWAVVSMIPFALSVYTYNTARIFTPLFLLSILVIYRKKLIPLKKYIILSIVIFTVLMIPLIPFVTSGDRSARYKLVSITDDPGLIPRINENRGNSDLPAPFPRLIHNKVTYIAFYATKNYLSHFSPQFLFISGAPHKQHHVQNIGELYYFQAPFLILGIIALLYRNNQFKGLFFAWVLLAFVPVAVTNDSIPHALRTLIAVPFYQLVSGFGFLVFWNRIKTISVNIRFAVISLLIITVATSVFLYLDNYHNRYPVKYSKDWQYGYKEVVEYIKAHENEYDQIIFSRHYGEPHMFTLFYLNYDPGKYQNDKSLERFETHDWVRVLKFGKYYFPDLGDKGTQFADIANNKPDSKLLFIGKDSDFPVATTRLFSIDFLDKEEKAFSIVETK